MLFISKLSKFNKLDVKPALFKIISVGSEVDTTTPEMEIVQLAPLAPPITLMDAYKAEKISKKAFLKGYQEYLESDAGRSIMLNTLEAIDRKVKGLFFVCSDSEWETGYLKYLSKYISNITGLEFKDPSEGTEALNKKLKKIEKENKKESKKVVKKSIAKFIENELNESLEMSIDGIDYLNKERKYFAIDQTVIALMHSGAVVADPSSDSDDSVAYVVSKDQKMLSAVKKKILLKAISQFASSKKGAKIVKKVADTHKIKVEKLEKKEVAEVITFILDLYEEILDKRYYSKDQDYSENEKAAKKDKKSSTKTDDKKKDKSGKDKKKDKSGKDKKKDKSGKDKSGYTAAGRFLISGRS